MLNFWQNAVIVTAAIRGRIGVLVDHASRLAT
jgi:hypothetical protein